MTSSFSYHAIDRAGHRLRGVEAAPNEEALTQALESRGLIVLDVATRQPPGAARSITGGKARLEVLEVTRALASLLPAGLPLARALATASGMASGSVAEAVDAVRGRVERGEPLAAALTDHPKLFSPLYVGLVRAGERSGDLAGAFARLSDQLERDDQLRARLLSVSIYPMLLAGAGGIAILVLLFLVIPRFVDLLQGSGATLPRSTAILLAFSGGLRRYWMLLAALPIGLSLLVVWLRSTAEGQRVGAQLLLRIPLLRGFRQHGLAARFSRLVGTLLSGGAPLLSALDDTCESIGDPVARDESSRVRARVREGVSLHRALAEGALFPPLLAQLVAVGEESGQLQRFLLKAADILEERTDRTLQRLVTLIEPAMIILFGGMVGFVALSLLQAIYSVNAGSFR